LDVWLLANLAISPERKEKHNHPQSPDLSISAGGGGAETWWPGIQSRPGLQEEGPWSQLGRGRPAPGEGTPLLPRDTCCLKIMIFSMNYNIFFCILIIFKCFFLGRLDA
jgi:hypothetical protein